MVGKRYTKTLLKQQDNLIRFLEHNEIDKKKWDAAIALSPTAVVYACSWYLDIVSPKWSAMVEDDYSSVFPLCQRSKFLFNYLFQPNFTQQGGLFQQNSIPSKEKLQQFLENIPSKYKLVEINLNFQNSINKFGKWIYQERKTHHLSLNFSIDEIRKKYSENLSRNIKKATKTAIHVESDDDLQSVISLFRSERGKAIKTLREFDYIILMKLFEQGNKQNLFELLVVKNSLGKLIAGALFLKSFHSYVFLFSATNNEARQNGAMSLILDHFIEQHQYENKVLDFEGSMDKDLARYYKSFGSQEIVYLQIRKNTLPPLIRLLK